MVIRGKGKSDTLFLIEEVYNHGNSEFIKAKIWIYFAHNILWGECFPKQLSDADEQSYLLLEVDNFVFFFLFCWIHYVTSSPGCTSLQFTTGYLGRKGKVLGFLLIHSKIELKILCELKTTVWISAASIENLILSLLISYLWGDILLWRMETSVR